MVILGDVEPNTVPSLLKRQSVVSSGTWQWRICLRPYAGTKVINEWPTLCCAKQAGALEYDRIYRRNVVPGGMHAPAAGGANVPKRHDRVSCGARGYVGTSATAAGDGVDGFEGPRVGKGERGGVGGAHVVNTHEAVKPTRDDDLIRGTPRGRVGRGGNSVHCGGPLQVGGVFVPFLRRAQRRGRRWGDGRGRDGMYGERGVGGRAKGGKRGGGRGGEKG